MLSVWNSRYNNKNTIIIIIIIINIMKFLVRLLLKKANVSVNAVNKVIALGIMTDDQMVNAIVSSRYAWNGMAECWES